jgi:signal transduction histidine kinase
MINGEALINFQNRYITKDGNYIWLTWNSIYFPDKELVFAIAKDITEIKLAEMEIEEKYKKFKGLATHFKTSIEEDRKYLAVELHEELAQLATVVKMDIEGIKINESDLSEVSTKRLDHALGVTTLLINTIRRISFSISPNMIEDIGLSETLKWHCKEFTLLNGIPCSFEGAIDELQLTQEIKLDFFRVCQEALTNVMYHAEAKNVIVRLEETNDKFSLTIIDDGKGFEINQHKQAPGIKSMRERATFINGHISIQSEKGKGTMVNVSVKKS